MELNDKLADTPGISLDEDRTNETIKRIRKLYWIGMEEEARRLEADLRQMSSGVVVLSGPFDTD